MNKATDYITHNDSDTISTEGTFRQDRMVTGFAELVTLFGAPIPSEYLDDNVDAAWDIEFSDGTIATVYNWQNGPKNENVALNSIVNWNIGGYERIAALNIKSLLS